MIRPLAIAFVGWRTAVLIGAGLLRLGGRIPGRVTELREEGFISDLFFRSDKSGPILVLNNTNRDKAQWRLVTLPLVEAGYLAFKQLIEFD